MEVFIKHDLNNITHTHHIVFEICAMEKNEENKTEDEQNWYFHVGFLELDKG